MPSTRFCRVVESTVALCVAASSMAAVAVAVPLDEAACGLLRAEQARLVQAGTRTEMEKGPDWARTHASVALLNDIARLIEVDENLAFRCPQPKPVIETKDDAEEGEAQADAKPKPKAKPKASAAVADPQPKPKPAPKAKPKPKPKTNDAYIPPAKSAQPAATTAKSPSASTPRAQVK